MIGLLLLLQFQHDRALRRHLQRRDSLAATGRCLRLQIVMLVRRLRWLVSSHGADRGMDDLMRLSGGRRAGDVDQNGFCGRIWPVLLLLDD